MSLDTILPQDGNNRTIVEAGVLTTLIDDSTTSGYVYIGKAIPGSGDATGTAKAIWQIVKIDSSTGDKKFAEGSVLFNKVWDNRASYVYS